MQQEMEEITVMKSFYFILIIMRQNDPSIVETVWSKLPFFVIRSSAEPLPRHVRTSLVLVKVLFAKMQFRWFQRSGYGPSFDADRFGDIYLQTVKSTNNNDHGNGNQRAAETEISACAYCQQQCDQQNITITMYRHLDRQDKH